METVKRMLFNTIQTARTALPRRFFTQWALPAAAAMLLAYASPFEEALFFGSDAPKLPVAALAFAAGTWCSLGKRTCLLSLMGVFAGSAAAGEYSGCAAAVLFCASLLALHALRQSGRRAIMKYAALLASCLVSLPVSAVLGISGFSFGGALTHLGASSLCAVLAFLFSQALSSFALSGAKIRRVSDIGLASLALLGGLISASFAHFSIFGLGLGAAFAAAVCLFSAHSFGLSSIALSAITVSVRVFAIGADISFIAALCLCTLSALLLRPLGKWGVLAGFSVCALALFGFLRGAVTLSPSELLLAASLFMVSDVKFGAALATSPSAREAKLERELESRKRSLNMLSDVLSEMARLFGDEDEGAAGLANSQLSGVAGSLAHLALPEADSEDRFSIGIGTAESPGCGSVQTGDTACIRELNGMSLAAISDGMGTGEAARRESEQTVTMVADLVSCGFNIADAAELVNRLLLIREGGESYATLDAMLFDRARGSVTAAKHGAPASYIVRHGRLNALNAEALPVGIVEEAKTAVFSVKIKRGDVLIMMSDGVSDALGEALDGAIMEAAVRCDPKAAARELVERAKRMGGEDDMTAIVARVG